MKEVNIYIVSGIKTLRRQNGKIAYCLEYYPANSKYPKTLIEAEQVEDVTGNRSDLIALTKALKRLNERCHLSIYSESTYLNMGLGERRLVDKWTECGWKTGKNVEVKNKDLWQEMLILLNRNEYEFYFKKPNAYEKMLHEKVE